MLRQPENDNGRIVAALFGKRDGHPAPERVKLIIDRTTPDGMFTISGSEDPIQVPVKVVFVKEFVRDHPPDRIRMEKPNLDEALEHSRETWGNFKPLGEYKIPLPASVKQ